MGLCFPFLKLLAEWLQFPMRLDYGAPSSQPFQGFLAALPFSTPFETPSTLLLPLPAV